ncbi:MAG: hypothetical protein AAB415_03185 [Patescibacteria group bacterium]
MLPSIGDDPTHVYVNGATDAEMVFDGDTVATLGLEVMATFIGTIHQARGRGVSLGDALVKLFGQEKAERVMSNLMKETFRSRSAQES